MRKSRQWIGICCAALLLQTPLHAQLAIKFRGSSGWCVGDRYDQAFINNSQENVVGQVMSVDTVTPLRDMSPGIQIRLKTEREDVNVQLGPTWFLLNQDISLSVNDKNIEVRGCRAVINGKPVIMASMMVRRDKVLLLRDADGMPYWCAWRPRFN